MKLLINGYTVSENLRIVRTENDVRLASLALDHIKRNKGMYFRLVLITATMLHFNMSYTFASGVDAALDSTFNMLIDMLKDFAKYGCLGMGLKRLIEEMLSGASFKQASVSGMQYWLCYIFIQFYPRLFDMIKL